MTAILQWMSRMAEISVKVQKSLNRLLGCDELEQNNKRMRGRNRKGPNPLSRSYESNGPDVKVRGFPPWVKASVMAGVVSVWLPVLTTVIV